MEFTDRYSALGMEHPDPKTVCEGHCEGTGVVPVFMGQPKPGGVAPESETDPALIQAWDKAEADSKADDGWHFVKCPDCGGSGKQSKPVTDSGWLGTQSQMKITPGEGDV